MTKAFPNWAFYGERVQEIDALSEGLGWPAGTYIYSAMRERLGRDDMWMRVVDNYNFTQLEDVTEDQVPKSVLLTKLLLNI